MLVIGLSVLLLSAGAGRAQSQSSPQLIPADQRVEDHNPLARSLRVVEDGLAAPAGFRQLYRLRGIENRFVRGQGALFAVFPESVYAPTRQGEVALVPAGTVFYIGLPDAERIRDDAGISDGRAMRDPEDLPPLLIGRQHDWRSDASRDRADIVSEADSFLFRTTGRRASSSDEGEPGIVSSETYRARRVRELLRRAANAERIDAAPVPK